MSTYIRETLVERRQMSVRWGAVIAGAVVAGGIGLLLQTFVMGAGLAAIDPRHHGSLRGLGIGAGVWWAVAMIVALFVGGIVAGQLSGLRERRVTAMHGAVMWAVATLAGTLLAVWTLGSLAAATVRTTADVVGGAAAVAPRALAASGLGEQDVVDAINARLRAEGKPTVTAAQLGAAARDAFDGAIAHGRLDRPRLIAAITDHTALSRADAEELADRIEARWSDAGDRAQELVDGAETQARTAGHEAGKGLLWLSLAMALGLVSSIAGGALGADLRRRRFDREATPRNPTVTSMPPPVAPGMPPVVPPGFPTPPPDVR